MAASQAAVIPIPQLATTITFTIVTPGPLTLTYTINNHQASLGAYTSATHSLDSVSVVNLYWYNDPSAPVINWGLKNVNEPTPVTAGAVPFILMPLASSTENHDHPHGSPGSIPPQTSVSATLTSALVSSSIITPAPSSTTKPISSSQRNGALSGGAVAGVAIGCVLAGALAAGLLLWFFCGRSNRSRRTGDREASAVALMGEKGARGVTPSFMSGSPTSQAMEQVLPQPLEDKAVSGEISKISNLIKNHVQSYYHSRTVSPGILDMDDLQALGHDLPVSAGTLSTLLGNSATREIALRFCIAWVVVTRMRVECAPSTSLLPPEIVNCFQNFSSADRATRVHGTFLGQWRALTAELLQSSYGRNVVSGADARAINISKAANVLDGILRPYADSRIDNSQRRRNLEEMLKRAAAFAFTIFSQPSAYGYDWQSEGGFHSGNLCLFPALIQVADESGEPVIPPRAFSEATVRRLDV